MDLKTAKNRSYKTLIALLSILILFHFSIIIKLIPYNIAWGGRLKNNSQMYIFEIVSIAINGLLMLVLLLKVKYIIYKIPEKILNIILWFFVILFALNTIGNLFAETNFEKFFAILTFILTILIWIILKKDSEKK